MNLINIDQFTLPHSPSDVASYITHAGKVIAYYPFGTASWQLSETQILCQGLFGSAFIEKVGEATFKAIKHAYANTQAQHLSDDALVITTQVFGLFRAKPEQSFDEMREKAFFTMYEDWILTPCEQGTQVTKTWRDLEKRQLKFLPLAGIVKYTGKGEQAKLLKAWAK